MIYEIVLSFYGMQISFENLNQGKKWGYVQLTKNVLENDIKH